MAFLFIALTNHWFGEAGKAALEFCEASKEGIIKQPANSWSNMAFIAIGLLIGWQAMKKKFHHKTNRNRMTSTLFFPTFLATLTVLLGPGSMAMHATTASAGGYFDMLSMYLLASFIFAYAFIRFFNLNEFIFFIMFLVVLGFCHYVHFYDGKVFGIIDVNIVFGLFAVGGVIIEYLNYLIYKNQINIKWALVFSTIFLLSFLIWNLSRTDAIFCDPNSLLQGHAIWHILDAITVYYMYRFYVSEKEISH